MFSSHLNHSDAVHSLSVKVNGAFLCSVFKIYQCIFFSHLGTTVHLMVVMIRKCIFINTVCFLCSDTFRDTNAFKQCRKLNNSSGSTVKVTAM